MKKVYKYFFYLFISIFLIILITLSFNSNLRRTSLNYIVNAYKVYMIVSIQGDLKNENLNLDGAVNKISTFIKNSKKIAYGKSSLLIGISDVLDLVESSIIHEKDFGKFETVLIKIVELDPTLHKARVLLAKSFLSNGKNKKAKTQINKALNLNPLDYESYRVLIKIELEKKDLKAVQKICKNYFNANLGGTKKRYKNTIFTGFNFNKFAIQLNPKEVDHKSREIYLVSGINLNKSSSYEVIPSKVIDLKNLNLLFNLVPGTFLEIREIILFNNLQKYIINQEDILITSKNSFFIDRGLSKEIFFTKFDNEIINLNFSRKYKNIEKIQLVLKFSKAKLLNKYCNNIK